MAVAAGILCPAHRLVRVQPCVEGSSLVFAEFVGRPEME
jgi:hypothetical protein